MGEGWGVRGGGVRIEKWQRRGEQAFSQMGIHTSPGQLLFKKKLCYFSWQMLPYKLFILAGCIVHFGRLLFESWLQAWVWERVRNRISENFRNSLTSYQRLYPVRTHQRNIEWRWDMNTVNTITHKNQLALSCPIKSKNKKLCEKGICGSRESYMYWSFQGGGVGRALSE